MFFDFFEMELIGWIENKKVGTEVPTFL